MFDGERLAELRKDSGLTQKELAAELEIGVRTLSSYERNEFSPSEEVQEKMAYYFDVSLDYLHGLIEQRFPLSKENFVILPKNHPPEYKKALLFFIDLLKLKFNVK